MDITEPGLLKTFAGLGTVFGVSIAVTPDKFYEGYGMDINKIKDEETKDLITLTTKWWGAAILGSCLGAYAVAEGGSVDTQRKFLQYAMLPTFALNLGLTFVNKAHGDKHNPDGSSAPVYFNLVLNGAQLAATLYVLYGK